MPFSQLSSSRFAANRSAVLSGAAVAALAALAHLTFYVAVPPRIWLDSHRYAAWGYGFWEHVAAHEWDLATPPGFPLFLWMVGRWSNSTAGVVLVQQVLAVLACLAIWLAIWRAEGPRVALLAGAIVALSPDRHYYAQSILNEGLAEFTLAVGVCLVLVGNRARLSGLVVSRTIAGFFMAATVLVRPNLGPFLVLLPFIPPDHRTGERGRPRFVAGLGAGLVAWLLLAPWLYFNAQRGVGGLNGSVGYQLIGWENDFGVGPRLDLGPLELHTTDVDRQLRKAALERIAQNPERYAHAAALTFYGLLIPFPPSGDVGPAVRAAADLPPAVPLPGFPIRAATPRWRWRWACHSALSVVYDALLPFSWLGLAWWGWRAARRWSGGPVFVAASSFLCLLALAALLMRNSRYTQPLEVFALGFGLPFLAVRARSRWSATHPRSGDSVIQSATRSPRITVGPPPSK